jgi:prophage regulatory protein
MNNHKIKYLQAIMATRKAEFEGQRHRGTLRGFSGSGKEKRLDSTLNAQRLIRLAEVATMLGIGRSTIYKYVDEGKFPAPIKIGIRSVRWKLADVLAWRSQSSE